MVENFVCKLMKERSTETVPLLAERSKLGIRALGLIIG